MGPYCVAPHLTAPESSSPDNFAAGAVHQEVCLPGVLHLHLLPPLPLPPPAGQAAPLANLRDPDQQHRAGRAHRRRTQAATDVRHFHFQCPHHPSPSSRRLKRGEVVAIEAPIVMFPVTRDWSSYCSSCLLPLPPCPLACPSCRTASYCSTSCRRAARHMHR